MGHAQGIDELYGVELFFWGLCQHWNPAILHEKKQRQPDPYNSKGLSATLRKTTMDHQTFFLNMPKWCYYAVNHTMFTWSFGWHSKPEVELRALSVFTGSVFFNPWSLPPWQRMTLRVRFLVGSQQMVNQRITIPDALPTTWLGRRFEKCP